jgi:hypothetical protein
LASPTHTIRQAKADKSALTSLFWALANETELVKPEKLGIIGRDNFDFIPGADPETLMRQDRRQHTRRCRSGVRLLPEGKAAQSDLRHY